jgi:hypothetical protein
VSVIFLRNASDKIASIIDVGVTKARMNEKKSFDTGFEEREHKGFLDLHASTRCMYRSALASRIIRMP